MKKIITIICLSVVFIGCKRTANQFTLKGEIANLGNDTVLVYGLEGNTDEFDTIFIENDKFSYTSNIDTITPLILLFKNMEECLVFADKKLEATILGDASDLSQLQVTGGHLNEDMNEFKRLIDQTKNSSNDHQAQAEEFIKKHPLSYVSIYLLDKYFVQQDNPDTEKIETLIKGMGGDLKDSPYIKQLDEYIQQENEIEIGKYGPLFNCKNIKGESITPSSFKDKYILLYFWASWCEPAMKGNIAIKEIARKFKKEKLAILGISLDIEKDKWLQAIKKDTLSWEQVSDLKGWENSIVKHYNIGNIPSNILMDSNRKIIAKNLSTEALLNRLEDIFHSKESTKK